MFSQKNLVHLLIIFLASIAAIFVHGYQFAVSDQEIFIPYILKSADPSLFSDDLLFKQLSADASFFYPLVGILTKFFDLEIIFFTGYLIFQFIFFLAIFRLGKTILASDRLSYLALLPFLLPKFIGGTATFTYDVFFGYRSVGLVFFIFFLVYILEKKFTKAAITASLGIWFHPLSLIPIIPLLPIFILKFAKNKTREALKSVILFLLVLIPYLLVSRANVASQVPYFFDQQWISIIKARDDYLFPSAWETRGWLAFFLYPALIIFCLNYLKIVKKRILLLLATCLSVFLVNFFLLDIIRIAIIAQFQIVRSIAPLAYLGLVMSPVLLTPRNLLVKITGAAIFISLSLNLFSPWIDSSIQFPKETDDWIKVQEWARQNTNPKDKFLVPPGETGFRIFSHRPIVGDIKDGAVVMYDRNYALYWYNVWHDLEKFPDFSENEFLALKEKYAYDYMVTTKSKKLNFEIVYQNQKYIVYRP